MIAATNKHQMSRHGRAGEPVGRFNRAEAPAAHYAQDWTLRGAGLFDFPSTRPGSVATGPGHFIRTAGGRCICAQRRADRDSSPQRRPVNLCAALLIGRSHQLNRISDKPGSDLAYPLHAQSFALSREQTCRAKEFRIVRTAFQGDRIVF